MPNIKFSNILAGMNQDQPFHAFKSPEWGNLRNGRTWVKSVDKFGGWDSEFTYTLGINEPRMLQFWRTITSGGVDQGYFVYALAGNIRRVSPLGDADIRPMGQDYVNVITGAPVDSESEWYSTAMSGGYNFVTGNNQITPQYINGDGTNLADLPGWVYGTINNAAVTATTCKVMRAFKNQLICGNLTHKLANGSVVQRPSTIRISDKSAPGGIPQSWQPVASNAADEFELTTTDPIQDIVIFGDYALVLCTNSIFIIGESTALAPTPVRQITNVRGAIGKEATLVVDGRVYVVTTDDVIVMDGTPTGFKSIANDIIKTWFFENQLDVNRGELVFARYHRYFNELFISYPNRGSTSCDRALVYSLDDGSWSWTDVPGIYDATLGPTVGNNDSERYWPVNTYNYNVSRLHFVNNSKLYALDIGMSRNGPFPVEWEKYFDFSDIDGLDASNTKSMLSLYPKIECTGPVYFDFKFYNEPIIRPVDWSKIDETRIFTPDNYKISLSFRPRYMAMRIRTNDTNILKITSFEIEMEEVGGANG